MPISKAAVLILALVQSSIETSSITAAFVLLLQSVAAENTAERVAASSYLPR